MNKVLEILKTQLPKNEAWWNTISMLVITDTKDIPF